MVSKEMYDKAYKLHYSLKKPYEAYCWYEKVIEEFPDSKEAKYSQTQIKNIQDSFGFSEEKVEEIKKSMNINSEIDKIKQKDKESEETIEKIRKAIINEEGILITTGYNFEGYKIVSYKNIVHGEVVLGTGIFSDFSAAVNDLLGTTSGIMEGKLSKAKTIAQNQMIRNCICKGANALIGVDYDVMTLGNNMIVVSANGTAVVIEKIED